MGKTLAELSIDVKLDEIMKEISEATPTTRGIDTLAQFVSTNILVDRLGVYVDSGVLRNASYKARRAMAPLLDDATVFV